MKKRIGVLLGGQSSEREISLKTGNAIYASLKRQGFDAVRIDASSNLPTLLKKNRISFAFIALHGPGGEDGKVQGLLEWMGIPYTGSGVLASAIAMDKVVSKQLFKQAGLPTPRAQVATSLKSTQLMLPLPVVVKPTTQGSAIGISVVRKMKDFQPALKKAFALDSVVLIEECVDGPEVTVGILGEELLPVIQIVPEASRPFYDFKAKYAPGGSRHLLPAHISTALQKRAQALALAACRAIGTRGAARVDLMIHPKKGPLILEVNTIPGMTETSLLPEAARAAGYSFDQLVLRIMELAQS